MKFTTQTTFALVSIVIFLGVALYTVDFNYVYAGFIFTFIFMPSKDKDNSKDGTKIENNNQINK